MTIHVNERVWLELTAGKHAKALYDAVDSNREHLSAFLPWVDSMQSIDDFHSYIKNCELLYQQKKEVSFVILLDDAAGRQNRTASCKPSKQKCCNRVLADEEC